MVADKVEVFTKSYKNNAEGLYWVSDGSVLKMFSYSFVDSYKYIWLFDYCRSGSYEIARAEGVQPGTKIVIHLRGDCREFSDEEVVNGKPIYFAAFKNYGSYSRGVTNSFI